MCTAPTNGENTEPVDATKTYLDGQTYTYECTAGYDYLDTMITTCQPDGSWSLTPPACSGES